MRFLGIAGILASLAGVFALFIMFSAFYTVDQGERAVVLRNGALHATADPGMHFKLPLIDSVTTISVQEHAIEFVAEPAYTSDRQTAEITMSVNYTAVPDEVQTIYAKYGSLGALENREINRVVKDQLKNVFGRFTAATAISDRQRMGQEILAAIQTAGDGLVTIQSVQIENIDFSAVVEQALEARSKAEAEVQTKKQELEKTKIDAQITVTQAQAEADSKVAQAKADAEAAILAGDAAASAIRAKGDALRENPQLVDLITAENWDGKLPATMLPSGTVPFINTLP